jgi:hypothetical protein
VSGRVKTPTVVTKFNVFVKSFLALPLLPMLREGEWSCRQARPRGYKISKLPAAVIKFHKMNHPLFPA